MDQNLAKEQDIATLALWLLAESPRARTGADIYFHNQAHNLLTGLFTHVLLAPESAGERNLRGLRQLIATPRNPTGAPDPDVRRTAWLRLGQGDVSASSSPCPRTPSPASINRRRDTQCLLRPRVAPLVCGNAFKAIDIAHGAIDVFLNLSTETVKNGPGLRLQRSMYALINALMQATRPTKSGKYLLDEVNLFGNHADARDRSGRGPQAGVMLMMVYQSITSLPPLPTGMAAAWFEFGELHRLCGRERSPMGQRGVGALRPDDDRGRWTSRSGGLFDGDDREPAAPPPPAAIRNGRC